MKKRLFRWLEPLIEAAITRRILLFHGAMVARGQIPPIKKDTGGIEEDSPPSCKTPAPDAGRRKR